jgi:hypothetical protein
MKNSYLLLFLFGIFQISNAQLTSWQTFTDSIPTLSSPRACDLNNDGIKDIVIGGGTDGVASNNGIMAYNGANGALLWKRGSRNEVFGSPIFQDITNDGIKDVFITGRQAQLLAINGSNGELIWDYFPYASNPADSGLYNFYNPQFIPDVNGDQMPDILVANGGNHAAPDWETDRPPGHLMVINSMNGQLLAKAVVPDSAETYCSPLVADIQGNGDLWVLYGTGGENLGGSFWACPLNDLVLSNSLANSIALETDSQKGFIAPAALCKTVNGGHDIIIQSFGGKIKKIKGVNFGQTWQFQLPNTESSAEPVLGNFVGGDNTPDVLAILFKGIAPSYSDFYQVLIDGSTGQMTFKDSLGKFNYVSANALDFDNNGRDEGLVSITYLENGTYKHRLQKINFNDGNISQVVSTKTGVNIGSTPLITDLDGDNLIDLVYAVKKDSLNPVGWKGIFVNRDELNISVPNAGIAWGSYLGTNNDGIYYLNPVDCGYGSVIDNAIVSQPTCNGSSNGSISLSTFQGTGPHTFLWSANSTDSIISNLSAETYSVTVTNALGCLETRSFTLSDPYIISFGGIIAPACPGGANGLATVNSSGCPCMNSPCTFIWDNGVATKPNNALNSGWHSVVITHPDGCVVTDSVFVPEPLPIIIDTNIVNNVCFGESFGSIELLNSNYQPVVYNWSNGDSTQLVDSLSAGNYTAIVSDARGCIDSLEFLISQPAELFVSSVVTNVLCYGESNGEILIQGQGGVGNYTHWLDQQSTSALNSNLSAGIYEVYVTDENNCSSLVHVDTIKEPQPLNATLSSTPQQTSLDGTASVNVSGGTAPYTYEWNDGNNQTEVMAVYLNSDWYTVVVTDANGCQLTDSVFVDSNVGLTEGKSQYILIYPNPTSEMLFFNVTAEKVEILDLNGRMVKSIASSNKIDVKAISSGNYLLKIISNDATSTHRFVKE